MPNLHHASRRDIDQALQAIADAEARRNDVAQVTAAIYRRRTPKEWFQRLPMRYKMTVAFLGGLVICLGFYMWLVSVLDKYPY